MATIQRVDIMLPKYSANLPITSFIAPYLQIGFYMFFMRSNDNTSELFKLALAIITYRYYI